MAELSRTYTFAFDPDPEGGFVVTCPALPGLVTCGATLDEAREMALDAMDGYIETLLEDGEPIPESDPPQARLRFGQLARTLRRENGNPSPLFEQIASQLAQSV